MIKLWLKHIILDTALNNLFNGLVDAFANPVAVKLIIGEQYAMIIEKAGNRVTKYERCLITHLSNDDYVIFKCHYIRNTVYIKNNTGNPIICEHWTNIGGQPIIHRSHIIQIRK